MPKFISPLTERRIRQNCLNFRLGNKSTWWLSGKRFFKLWSNKAPGHNLLLSSNYRAMSEAGMVAQLEDYGRLTAPCIIRGDGFGYVYVFSKLEARPFDIDEALKALDQAEYWWIDNLYLFFMHIQLAGFTYFDIDWSNFGISNGSIKNTMVIFYDVDSSCPLSEDHSKTYAGNKNFHTLYHYFRNKFGIDTIKFFNVAVLAELYIATVFAHAANKHNLSRKILRRNPYMVQSYYNWRRGKISAPSTLMLGNQKEKVINEFLTATVEICQKTFMEKKHPKNSIAELRESTLKTFEELSSLPLITPSPVSKYRPKSKPRPKTGPQSNPKPRAKSRSQSKPRSKPRLTPSPVGSTIIITISVVGLSVFLRNWIMGSTASSIFMGIFLPMLFWVVAPITYVLTKRAWAALLSQSLILIIPWAIDGYLLDILGVNTVFYIFSVSLPPSVILWSAQYKRVSVWRILASVLSGVVASHICNAIIWEWMSASLIGIELASAVIAVLISVMIGKFFGRWQ